MLAPLFAVAAACVLLVALVALVRAGVARLRAARRDRYVAHTSFALGFTADEEEVFAQMCRLSPEVDPQAWRRVRLRRLAAQMCEGLPGTVHRKLLGIIDEDPRRAAAIVDTEDSFRVWALADGIVS